jgi:hypothetical protein
MSARPQQYSSEADLRGVSLIRYEWSIENLISGSLPPVPLQSHFEWEAQRPHLGDPFNPQTIIFEGKRGDVQAILDIETDPLIHRPELALMAFGVTRLPFRQQHAFESCVDYASDYFKTSFLRTALPKTLVSLPPTPAVGFLRKHGFRETKWKQLSRIYEPDDFSLLRQAFWEAADLNRMPFRFGERNELMLALANPSHLREVTELRLGLAKELRYDTHFELVEMSVDRIINRSLNNASSLLVVLDNNKKVIACVRVTPGYGVWDGYTKLGIRDIVIAKSHQGRGLLPWIFNAAVVGGRMLIHPDQVVNPQSRCDEPLRVETWLPNETLMRHFRNQIPRLTETGHHYFENF